MHFFPTSRYGSSVTFSEALFRGFAPDGSLYVPVSLPYFSLEEILSFSELSFTEISFLLAKSLFKNEIPEEILLSSVHEAFNFPVNLVNLSTDSSLQILELFHGPTLSFKDFGARFMAQVIKSLWKGPKKLIVLVATTGDTGSAVGNAFHEVPWVDVYILFPKGQVTPFQEKQLTTIDGNVQALEIEGSFDDCQCLLRTAITDAKLRKVLEMTTGNSINIGRLLPQSFYFFYAYCRLKEKKPLIVSVPSGNFGHLVSCILAKKMGLPIERFLAATNINNEVPLFLKSGIYHPHESLHTIAVSMDVGNPSNFSRLSMLYHDNLAAMRKDLVGMSYTDDEIRKGIQEVYEKARYIIDPHGAVSYCALRDYFKQQIQPNQGLVLATAHPSKFIDAVQPIIPERIEIPKRLQNAIQKEGKAISLSKDYTEFKKFLLQRV